MVGMLFSNEFLDLLLLSMVLFLSNIKFYEISLPNINPSKT
jgi:hypothetical protein